MGQLCALGCAVACISWALAIVGTRCGTGIARVLNGANLRWIAAVIRNMKSVFFLPSPGIHQVYWRPCKGKQARNCSKHNETKEIVKERERHRHAHAG